MTASSIFAPKKEYTPYLIYTLLLVGRTKYVNRNLPNQFSLSIPQDWHSDNPGHWAFLWDHKDFQDRLVWLWEKLSEHYKDNAWIAGFNVLNEPCDPKHTRLIDVYDRLHNTIRKIDTKHVIFLDGNTFASDFSHFGESYKKWTNTAYSIHDYSSYGFPQAPEFYTSSEDQKARLNKSFERKREWMVEKGLCVWNGEWGPVYARKQYDGEATDKINESRYRLLKDQLEIYDKVCVWKALWPILLTII